MSATNIHTDRIVVNGVELGAGTIHLGALPGNTGDDAAQALADAMYAALREVDAELAHLFAVFVDDDGTPYVEHLDELDPAELELLERAERLAREVLR